MEIYWPQASPRAISVDNSKAREFKENLRLLIVADPQHSYYTSEKAKYIEATFSHPASGVFTESRAVLKPITACYYNKKTKRSIIYEHQFYRTYVNEQKI